VETNNFVFENMSSDLVGPMPGCILHFSGGYTDPVEGKNARMMPVWKQIQERWAL
jgi:hypothetical protein